MFGRQKQALFNTVDDSRATVYDFRRRFPYESYRPADYTLYSKLEESEMLPKLDAHLTVLLAGEVDEANGNMADSLIFDVAYAAVADLDRQRCNHGDMLRRLIARRQADREDFVKMLEERKRELSRLERDFKTTCRMLAKDSGEEVEYE